jgi:UDP-2,3-diacylglucosamine hydrolase
MGRIERREGKGLICGIEIVILPAMKNRVYFLSDVHLGWGSRGQQAERQDRLARFLRAIRSDAEALYIVGDLFDFWFEYRTVIPRTGARVLFEIRGLIENGTRVFCVPGNHDLWLGPFLTEEVGIRIAPGGSVVRHQGIRIWLDHGDDLLGGWTYRFVKRVLRNPVAVALFRLLHPDFGALLARMVSNRPGMSPVPGGVPRAARSCRMLEIYGREARRRYGAEAEVVVFGHLHRPVLRREEEGTLLILGDWVKHYTYGVLEDGRMEIRTWPSVSGEADGTPPQTQDS